MMMIDVLQGAAGDGEHAPQSRGGIVADQSRSEEDGNAAVLRRDVARPEDEREPRADDPLRRAHQ